MRFVSTRGGGEATFAAALLEGLAGDGGLYMPQRIDRWPDDALAAVSSQPLAEIAVAALSPFVGDEIPVNALRDAAASALSFPIPLVEIEPGLFVLELFHGPTLAFKDVGARTMARLIAAVRGGESAAPLTILSATSGDTGGAVGHAFAAVPGTRVVILYPDGRVSPTQEAQLVAFNGDGGSNVQAYAVSGTFDDCQRLVKAAFADRVLRAAVELTSANSINIGRLLPQTVYYFKAAGELAARGFSRILFSTPSGNFGNLTAGVMARRAGAPIAAFVAATNVNDVVPAYLASGIFEPRPSIATIANAMDCGDPSNFDRLRWLYGGDAAAMRGDIAGSAHSDDDVREAIRCVDRERGYLMDPHTAIAYLGARHAGQAGEAGRAGHGGPGRQGGREGQVGWDGPEARVFLATAHPAKFAEIVEPIVGRTVDVPPALAAVVSAARRVVRIAATDAAVRRAIMDAA